MSYFNAAVLTVIVSGLGLLFLIADARARHRARARDAAQQRHPSAATRRPTPMPGHRHTNGE
ncbi:hypothetical protein [Peterkaempfera griseoplana]|uniref:hypothetical protein n=1 Tax=Peterkaempfera griseoplana TaxID=66896 RepID=UPI0006E19620|nr:hypothetical protein [Peterkaempfera griseoplana]